MALKQLSTVSLLSVVTWACTPPPPPVAAADEEPEPHSVTRWTDQTELFAEYPPLVVGETSRFTIHLTRLDTFKPVTEGRVEVHLTGGDASGEAFHVEGPSSPGIFGVDVTPAHPGSRELVIILRAPGLADEHGAGEVEVHASAQAARAAAVPDGSGADGVGFLKEQQWTLDFATGVVRERAVRESIRVPARIEARPGGAADVIAPLDGRLTTVLDAPLGATVSRGQELARLLPPPAAPGDLPQLERARAEAQSALAFATRDRERAERLVTAGAAPQRRLEEARAAEEQAKARAAAAEASLAQFQAVRSGGAAAEGQGLFVIRAPVAGVIAQRSAAPGASVTAGTILFRVVDASQVHVAGQIPEAEASRARAATSAEIQASAEDVRIPAGRLVGLGKVLDPASRTLPITFAFDNSRFAFPVGQAVFLHLLMDAAAPGPAVPAAAIVDDAGRPIVFVQVAGETFARRPVTLGARSGGLVQIADGVGAGERVVTTGAYLIRLAALSTSVPAHGHVH